MRGEDGKYLRGPDPGIGGRKAEGTGAGQAGLAKSLSLDFRIQF